MLWQSAARYDNCWRNFINHYILSPLSTAIVYMTLNPIQHRWMKHIEIAIHFVREKVSIGQDVSLPWCGFPTIALL
jgi:hypothetical protein